MVELNKIGSGYSQYNSNPKFTLAHPFTKEQRKNIYVSIEALDLQIGKGNLAVHVPEEFLKVPDTYMLHYIQVPIKDDAYNMDIMSQMIALNVNFMDKLIIGVGFQPKDEQEWFPAPSQTKENTYIERSGDALARTVCTVRTTGGAFLNIEIPIVGLNNEGDDDCLPHPAWCPSLYVGANLFKSKLTASNSWDRDISPEQHINAGELYTISPFIKIRPATFEWTRATGTEHAPRQRVRLGILDFTVGKSFSKIDGANGFKFNYRNQGWFFKLAVIHYSFGLIGEGGSANIGPIPGFW